MGIPTPIHAVVSVALYLTLVSAGEVVVASGHGPGWALTVVLLVALAAKVLGVALVYMGLYQAPGGVKVGVGTAVLLVVYAGLVMVVPTLRAGGVSPSDMAPLVAGRPARGREWMGRFGCVNCHNVPGAPHLEHGLCPDLSGVADRAPTREPGVSAEAYLRESIEDPDAYVVRGYLPWMPALRSRMTRQEFEDIVAFLMTLHTEESPREAPGEAERTGVWRKN